MNIPDGLGSDREKKGDYKAEFRWFGSRDRQCLNLSSKYFYD